MVNYTNLLKEYNLKVTPQRVAIVEELSNRGHLNIDALYKTLQIKFPSISLATIYKNINAMIEKLFVTEVKIEEKKSVFELAKSEHAHVVCSQCGKIEDLMIDISSVLNEASISTHFTINKTSLCFTGLCKTCSK